MSCRQGHLSARILAYLLDANVHNFNDVCARIKDCDKDALSQFNSARQKCNQQQYVLRDDLGPSPFEGDINAAPVVLLLANPSSADVQLGDHRAPEEEWPLHGLGPTASELLRRWWSKRLRHLMCEANVTMQDVSRSVAALQLNPWASEAFHSGFKGDSRKIQFAIAQTAMARRAIVVLMRAKAEWSRCPGLLDYSGLIETRNPRCSYLSPGNLEADAWENIVKAVSARSA